MILLVLKLMSSFTEFYQYFGTEDCLGHTYSHNVSVLDLHIGIFCILMFRVAYLSKKELDKSINFKKKKEQAEEIC